MKLETYIKNWINNVSEDSELQGFVIKGDKLYVKNNALILLAIKECDYIHIRFRNDVKKYLKKFFKYCGTNKIVLHNRLGDETGDDIHYLNISNMFTFYVSGDMYDSFHKNNIDIFRTVVNYINYYSCEEDFYMIFEPNKRSTGGKRRYYHSRIPSIEFAVRGRYKWYNWMTMCDEYTTPPDKYLEELDIDNMKRRFKLEKMFLDLDIDI